MFRAAMVQRAMLVLGILLTASLFAGFRFPHLAHAVNTHSYVAVNGNDSDIGVRVDSLLACDYTLFARKR